MDQVDLDALIQLGKQLYAFIIFPPCGTLSSVVLYRLTDKVILRIPSEYGGGAKSNRVSPHAALYDLHALPVALRLLLNLWR